MYPSVYLQIIKIDISIHSKWPLLQYFTLDSVLSTEDSVTTSSFAK